MLSEKKKTNVVSIKLKPSEISHLQVCDCIQTGLEGAGSHDEACRVGRVPVGGACRG